MNRLILVSIAVLSQLLASAPLLSQDQPAPAAEVKKGKIASIKFTGVQSYPEAPVLEAFGLHKGDLVSKEDLQAAADRLLQLGIFATVNYSFKSRGDDLDLIVAVAEAPSVPVSFDNIPWYTDPELVEAIQKAVPLFSARAPQQGAMLDIIATALQKLLAQRGLSISVAHDLVNDPLTDEMVQQFRVEGASLIIGRIDFTDALATESRSVQARLSKLTGKPFSRFAVDLFVSEYLRPIYFERGRLRVRFGRPEVRLTGNPAKPSETINVVIPIEPGPVYRWNGVRWSGNRALTAESLDALLALKTNEVANGNNINAAWTRAEDEYGRRGYLDVKLSPTPVFDDSKALARYTVTVAEGPQYHMGELVITGLSLAAERKLRAAWPIPPGTIFDRALYETLLAKLLKPSPEIFAEIPVHYDEAGHWLRTNPANATVDVLLDFK